MFPRPVWKSTISRTTMLCPQVILPELWDTAVDLFDASRAGVVSDRKRTQKVQEKVRVKSRVRSRSLLRALANDSSTAVPPTDLSREVQLLVRLYVQVMNKYLKHKYRELKMYVKNGWWGYERPAPRSGRQHGNTSDGVKDPSRRLVLAHCLLASLLCARFVTMQSTSFCAGACPPGLSISRFKHEIRV